MPSVPDPYRAGFIAADPPDQVLVHPHIAGFRAFRHFGGNLLRRDVSAHRGLNVDIHLRGFLFYRLRIISFMDVHTEFRPDFVCQLIADLHPVGCDLADGASQSVEERIFSTGRELLAELSEPDRKLVELHCVDGLSWSETARRMEISEPAARKRFERAKKRLEKLLNKQ